MWFLYVEWQTRQVPDTRPKSDRYGYEFLSVGGGTNLYPQPLCWRVGNYSTQPKHDPLSSLLFTVHCSRGMGLPALPRNCLSWWHGAAPCLEVSWKMHGRRAWAVGCRKYGNGSAAVVGSMAASFTVAEWIGPGHGCCSVTATQGYVENIRPIK
jgi:hypothetical protein